jgi:hypothetical protein
MMTDWYILDGKTPRKVESTEEWARWQQSHDKHVAHDEIGGVRVSTVFLGLDHSWLSDGPPLIFETMIFGGPHSDHQTRASTWDEAERQHAEAVAMVRSGLN